jgi:hypothetical protein
MDKQIKLVLPLPVVEWLLNVVNEQPRKVSDPVFQLIVQQAQAQVNPQPQPVTPAEGPEDVKAGLTD